MSEDGAMDTVMLDAVREAIDYLYNVRTGDDRECKALDRARDLYIQFHKFIDDNWEFDNLFEEEIRMHENNKPT